MVDTTLEACFRFLIEGPLVNELRVDPFKHRQLLSPRFRSGQQLVAGLGYKNQGAGDRHVGKHVRRVLQSQAISFKSLLWAGGYTGPTLPDRATPGDSRRRAPVAAFPCAAVPHWVTRRRHTVARPAEGPSDRTEAARRRSRVTGPFLDLDVALVKFYQASPRQLAQPGVEGERALLQIGRQLPRGFGQRLLHDVRRVHAGAQTRIEPHGYHAAQSRPMLLQQIGDRLLATRAAVTSGPPRVGRFRRQERRKSLARYYIAASHSATLRL